MSESPPSKKRRYVRLTRWRRRRFFALLAESGSVRLACELSGVGLGCIYRLRRTEAGFVAAMDAARAKASAALGARGAHPEEAEPPALGRSPLAPGEPADDLVIRRGVGGRLRVMAPGRQWWSSRNDAIFLGHLRVTGNVAASARAAGFTPKSAWNRREKLPSFARDWDAAMAMAETILEYRLFAHAAIGCPGMETSPVEEPEEFDPWWAMWLLTWRDKRRNGEIPTRRSEPDIDTACAKVMRNIEAIERFEKMFGKGGFAEGGKRG